MSILDTRVLLLSLPSWTPRRLQGGRKAGRGTIELVEEPRSARAAPEVSKMPYVPSDIFHAAADGIKLAQFPPAHNLMQPPNEYCNERPASSKRTDLAKIRTWIERGGDVNGEADPALVEGTELNGQLDVPVVYPGNRLLTVAAECGRVDVMRLLLANGADVNYVNHESFEPRYIYMRDKSAILAAACRCEDDAVRLLIDHGADVNAASDGREHSVIGFATKHHRILKMVLATLRVNIDWRDSSGRTAEYQAGQVDERLTTMLEQPASMAAHYRQSPEYAETVLARDYYRESCAILRGTRLAGSYKKYVIQTTYQPAKDLLLLRSLVCGSKVSTAGRAAAGPETATAVARLFDSCPDNGVFWLVMQYWQLGDWRRP